MSSDAEVRELINAVHERLAGKSPEMQGVALADNLASWLAGHVVEGDETATRELRESLLEFHLGAVRALIPFRRGGGGE